MAATGITYRADIEGLRAVAVLAVILNHAGASFASAGFLGVDIFFVISGYVITLSLLSSRSSGAAAFFLGFYTRRVKRITPALIFCIAAATVILSLIDPNPATSLETAAYALFGAANLFLYSEQIDYFATDIGFNAFMHMWSLGIEEQFYLLLPLLVWFVPSGRRLTYVLSALATLSLGLFVLLRPSDPVGSFYLLPARFWELAAGAVLAAVPITKRPTTKAAGVFTLQTGFLAIGLVGLGVQTDDARLLTVAMVATTMAVIAAPDRSILLTNPVATLLGKLSYSLYLWHWPLLVFRRLSPTSVWASDPMLGGLLVLAAAVSFHGIEQPLRRRIWARRPSLSLIYGGLASVAVAVALVLAQTAFRPTDVRQLLQDAGSVKWEDAFLNLPQAAARLV